MAGLYSALNISKNALLAFQTAVHVTGHNVANVDTEGYSRQKVVNAPYPPTPGPAGPMGSGVKVEQIKRYFDAFLEANLNLKRSDLGLLSAEETGLDLIQGLFNETNPQGLSALIEDFFSAWQGLSNRAEGIPERRVVIEKGRVLAEAINDRYQGLVELEQNVRLKLEDVIKEINELAKQIAELNRQITAAESGLHQANDLRDQRDKLVSRLSELAEIRYFENNQGAYAVVLGKGYNLVDIDSYWQLDLAGGEVYWEGHSGEKVRLTSEEVTQGALGGWLRIIEQISEDWNHEYVISQRSVFTKAGKVINERTTWEELGLSGSVTIEFQGTNHFGEEIKGTYSTTDLQETVRDFLDQIEKSFDYQVSAYLTEEGRLVVKDAFRGGGELTFAINSGPLDFGRFDDEAANHRVKELNLTGKFELFAEELIRAVNEIHTEGVGLKFFEGELEGLYHTDGSLKSLPFFYDLKGNGSFFLWVKDPHGTTTPVRIELSLAPTATLEDVATQINTALEKSGFKPEETVRALFRQGKLVFQAQEGYGFAFSNDTSGILLVTGLNVFFGGFDAGSIEINDQLSVNPEYLAAARLDREAWRTERSLSGSYVSRTSLKQPEKIVFHDPPHRLFIRFYDQQGRLVLHEEDGYQTKELSILIEPGDNLPQILAKLDALPGLRAYLDDSGRLRLELDPNADQPYAYFELGIEEPPPTDSFLSFLREEGVYVPQYLASNGRKESNLWLEASDVTSLSLNEGAPVTLTFTFFDASGQETGKTTLEVPDGTTLEDLVTVLDAQKELRAGLSEGDHGKIFLSLAEAPSGSVSFSLSVAGGDGDGKLKLSSGDYLSFEDVSERQLFSGLEPWLKPKQYVASLAGAQAEELEFSGWLNLRFFDAQGNELATKSFATYGSPDVLVSDTNGNSLIDLEDLVAALNGEDEFFAYLDNGELVIQLADGAPEGTTYFVIEANNPERAWGEISLLDHRGTSSSRDDRPVNLKFEIGALENWLFDEAGQPLDADSANETLDPFRLVLSTEKGVVQILEKYNQEENARYGLRAEFDPSGRLVVRTSGLYETESFIVSEAWRRDVLAEELRGSSLETETNTYFLLTDQPVNLTAVLADQDVTVNYLDANGNPVHTETIDLDAGDTLADFLTALNSLDSDADGVSDFEAQVDSSGRLLIRVNDPDLNQDGNPEWVNFSLSSSLPPGEGNLVSYLARRFYRQDPALVSSLGGLSVEAGDNRNALRLSALTHTQREKLGEASVADYYGALVGEIGIATKTVKNSKTFMEDLINQLQTMRDSVSAVSLDEEMANLIKYQQAFAASAKILTVADEMLDTLIAAKR